VTECPINRLDCTEGYVFTGFSDGFSVPGRRWTISHQHESVLQHFRTLDRPGSSEKQICLIWYQAGWGCFKLPEQLEPARIRTVVG
jgi:hypothetical protein